MYKVRSIFFFIKFDPAVFNSPHHPCGKQKIAGCEGSKQVVSHVMEYQDTPGDKAAKS